MSEKIVQLNEEVIKILRNLLAEAIVGVTMM